jgi:hypothetical protein
LEAAAASVAFFGGGQMNAGFQPADFSRQLTACQAFSCRALSGFFAR